MSTSPRLAAVLLLATAVALLLAASSAAASGGGGGRMVFVHGPGTTKVVGRAAAGALRNEWRHYLAARVEDEVAPDLEPGLGGMLATNSNGGRISTGALNRDRAGCQSGNQCAARAGGSYTRPCTYKNQCPH